MYYKMNLRYISKFKLNFDSCKLNRNKLPTFINILTIFYTYILVINMIILTNFVTKLYTIVNSLWISYTKMFANAKLIIYILG